MALEPDPQALKNMGQKHMIVSGPYLSRLKRFLVSKARINLFGHAFECAEARARATAAAIA